jgi:hypothetical protein
MSYLNQQSQQERQLNRFQHYIREFNSIGNSTHMNTNTNTNVQLDKNRCHSLIASTITIKDKETLIGFNRC